MIGIVKSQVDNRYIGAYMGSFFNRAYIRHSLGFLVHNQVPLAFMIVYMLFICIRRQKISFWENLLVFLINLFLFDYCGSRITFIIVLLTLFMYYYVKLFERTFHRPLQFPRWSSMVFLVFAAISIIGCYCYNTHSDLFLKLDLWFNNRLSMGHAALDYYGLSVLGSGAKAATYEYLANNTVDNGYVAILIQRGIIIMPLIIVMWTTIISHSIRVNPYITLVLILLAVENVINAHLTSFKLIPLACILLNTDDPYLLYRQTSVIDTKKKLFYV